MAIHLTPTELAREAGLERKEVIAKCMEMGVPIFQGRIDKTLFLANLGHATQQQQQTSSAAGSLGEAVAGGLDAFLTGEPKEHVMGEAADSGIHFIAAGHYATETFGVRRLGEWLAREFGVRHSWVDLPNPV